MSNPVKRNYKPVDMHVLGVAGIREVADLINLSVDDVRAACSRGDMPRPQRIAVDCKLVDLWQLDEIMQWHDGFNAAKRQFWRIRENQDMDFTDIMELFAVESTPLRGVMQSGRFIEPCYRKGQARFWAYARVAEWREQYMDIREVVKATGLFKLFIEKRVKRGEFPKPVIRSKGFRLWACEDVQPFIIATSQEVQP